MENEKRFSSNSNLINNNHAIKQLYPTQTSRRASLLNTTYFWQVCVDAKNVWVTN